MSTLSPYALPTAWTAPGSLDPTFAIGGVAQVYFAGSLSSQTQHVELDAQGRILVAAKVGTAKEVGSAWRGCWPMGRRICRSAFRAA